MNHPSLTHSSLGPTYSIKATLFQKENRSVSLLVSVLQINVFRIQQGIYMH